MADEDTAAAGDAAAAPSAPPASAGKPDKPDKPGKAAGKGGKAGKTGKAGKAAKGKRGAGAGAGGAAGSQLVLAEHPRAVRAIARTKAWGGLGGFLLGGYLSLPTHTVGDAAFRALVAGVVCYVAAWGAAVFLWRRLMVVELRHAQQELLATEIAKLRGANGAESPTPGPGPAAALARGRERAGV